MTRRVPISIDSTDLILEITSRSSAKSIARFRRVSKFWASMLRSPYITELFQSRSSTQPRLLIALEKSGEWIFCSSPQLQNPENSSLGVTAEFHLRLPADWCLQICAPVSGLIYCPNSQNSMGRLPVICKPSTGQQVSLPRARTTKQLVHSFSEYCRIRKQLVHSFFGYDPILKQFKVLLMSRDKESAAEEYQVLTLGTVNWRLKRNRLTHYPLSEGICINGVLYYIARRVVDFTVVLAYFDVSTEKFKLIREANGISLWSKPSVLVNFKGKIGGIQSEWRANEDGKLKLELCLWVLENVDKSEWSKRIYALPDLWENRDVNASVSIAGVTSTSEIVLSMDSTTNPFYVFYF